MLKYFLYEIIKDSETPYIYEKTGVNIHHYMIDEFQDINQIQYDIVHMMAQPHNNLFMVGDDDQSIYGFRGSKSEIMLHVPLDYPDLKRVELDINYRCHKDIIEASQRVIGYNEKRYSKNILPDYSQEKEGKVEYFLFENQFEEIKYILKSMEEQNKKGKHHMRCFPT